MTNQQTVELLLLAISCQVQTGPQIDIELVICRVNDQ